MANDVDGKANLYNTSEATLTTQQKIDQLTADLDAREARFDALSPLGFNSRAAHYRRVLRKQELAGG
jgi:hypothetical protein